MHADRLAQGLESASTFLAPEAWRLIRPLIRKDTHAAAVALESMDESLLRTLTQYGLCGWANHVAGGLGRGIGERLTRPALRELAACAQRKAALHTLDTLADLRGVRPIIIKGAATALTYYPKESLRPSHDIDVLVHDFTAWTGFQPDDPPGANPIGTQNRHLAPTRIGGYLVEFHEYFVAADRWGTYDDLVRHAQPLPGFRSLLQPGSTEAFTIALLHFGFHVGEFTFDFLDLREIARASDFSWDECEALWRREDLLPLLLPALAVLGTLGEAEALARWGRLMGEISFLRKIEVRIGLRLLVSRRFKKLRKDWFRTRLSRWSLVRPMFQRLSGSRAATTAATGRTARDPIFWLFHFIFLPARRLTHFWQ